MSRRREPRKPSSVEGSFVTVRVVCTGRRTHPTVSFGHVKVFPSLRDEWGGGLNIHLVADDYFVEAEIDGTEDASSARRAMHTTYTMRCRRCTPSRSVPLTKPTLEKLVDRLATRGESKLDISALGAIGPL